MASELAALLQEIMDIESVSGNERELADLVEARLSGLDHLEVFRDGDCVVARTGLGAASASSSQATWTPSRCSTTSPPHEEGGGPRVTWCGDAAPTT